MENGDDKSLSVIDQEDQIIDEDKLAELIEALEEEHNDRNIGIDNHMVMDKGISGNIIRRLKNSTGGEIPVCSISSLSIKSELALSVMDSILEEDAKRILDILINSPVKHLIVKVPDIGYIDSILRILLCYGVDGFFINITHIESIFGETNVAFRIDSESKDQKDHCIANIQVSKINPSILTLNIQICINNGYMRNVEIPHYRRRKILTFITTEITVPRSLRPYVKVYRITYPSMEDIVRLLQDLFTDVFKVRDSDELYILIGTLIPLLRGLSLTEIIDLIMYKLRDTFSSVLMGRKNILEILPLISRVVKEYRNEIFRDLGIELLEPSMCDGDFIGYKDIYREIEREIIIRLFSTDKHSRNAGGILLVGLPGVGKTTLTCRIAREHNIPIILLKATSIVSHWYGDTETTLRNILERAESLAPVIIVIDEAEQLLLTRTLVAEIAGNVTDLRISNILLDYMGKSGRKVLFIAITNRIDMIDDAFLRPGRFSRVIYIPLPSKIDRRKILEHYIKIYGIKTCKNIDIEKIVSETELWTGDELAELAYRVSIDYDNREVCTEDILRYIERFSIDKSYRLKQVNQILSALKNKGLKVDYAKEKYSRREANLYA